MDFLEAVALTIAFINYHTLEIGIAGVGLMMIGIRAMLWEPR